MPEKYKKYLKCSEDGSLILDTSKWAEIEDKDFQFEVMDYAFDHGNCILLFN